MRVVLLRRIIRDRKGVPSRCETAVCAPPTSRLEAVDGASSCAYGSGYLGQWELWQDIEKGDWQPDLHQLEGVPGSVVCASIVWRAAENCRPPVAQIVSGRGSDRGMGALRQAGPALVAAAGHAPKLQLPCHRALCGRCCR